MHSMRLLIRASPRGGPYESGSFICRFAVVRASQGGKGAGGVNLKRSNTGGGWLVAGSNPEAPEWPSGPFPQQA